MPQNIKSVYKVKIGQVKQNVLKSPCIPQINNECDLHHHNDTLKLFLGLLIASQLTAHHEKV